MTFLITLIVLVIERFFHWHHLRHWRWFIQYEHGLSIRLGRLPSVFRLIIILLPLLIVIGLLNILLEGWLYGLLQLMFGVAVLLYCLGPENLWVQVYHCLRELNQEGSQAAYHQVAEAFHFPHTENVQLFHREFVRAIFIAAHQRIFSVVFWFVILGPVGAVLYRLIELLSVRTELGLEDIAHPIKSALDWIPVRIYTFLFALGGHFTEVIAVWKQGVFKNQLPCESLISSCGIAALDAVEEGHLPENGEAEKEALELLDRVLVMGLVILAVLVLIF